jgi:PBP1b-binding outer membrane lipoprotein LpoB
MKIKIPSLLFIILAVLFAGCNENKKTNTETKENKAVGNGKTDSPTVANNNIDLQAPDFADPELKKYYNDYTDYLKKVLTAIRYKDEAGTMKIFTEEGKQFNNRNEMDQKAQSAEKQKFNSWLLQSAVYQKEIVQSDYYKKFTEEYYKKVSEEFKKKGY